MSERVRAAEYYDVMRRAHTAVWAYRARLADKWPTPATADALRFAFCEASEALDAWLRLQPQYVRNNARDLSVTDELADCAMMLLTALGVGGMPPQWVRARLFANMFVSTAPSIDDICIAVAEVHRYRDDVNMLPWRIVNALMLIVLYPGMPPLDQAVAERLSRIAAKVEAASHEQ